MPTKPYIVLHTSVTLDGSSTGFMPDMELHYRLANGFEPDANLIGSATVVAGQTMFGGDVPAEEEGDFEAPKRDPKLPWWILVDSGGKLEGLLHTCRRLEYCRDVIVLVSESTPASYLKHLEARRYRSIRAGSGKVDLRLALSRLADEFGIGRIVTDTGPILSGVLLNEGLVDEVSLLVHPIVKGDGSRNLMGEVRRDIALKLDRAEAVGNGCVWLLYKTT